MNAHLQTSFRRLVPVLLVLVLVMVYSLIQFGCTNRISGTQTENKKPVVFFVNVPPESTKVSRNPVISWIGTDADGQVKYFRYLVVREDSLGGLTPAQFAAQRLPNLDSTLWTYLTVTVDNPMTSNSVKMSADLQNPVNHYYPQYVFLQAFDDKNLGSDIVWRLLLRNDNPPITFINAIVNGADNDTSHPFINSVLPGGAITGIRLTWRGSDPIDHPKDPPPFQFQWKLLGPYQYNNTPTDTFHLMIQKWVKKVFLANDGLVYAVGQGAKIVKCDTTLGVANCDTILVDTIKTPGALGAFDSMLVMNDSFKNDSVYYRLVDSSTSADGSGWTYATTDTFWDAFRLRRGTITRQDKFIFWARCRDDASVPDPVPAWRGIDVVDPHYERGVLVVDLVKVSNTVRVNAPFRDTARNYWTRMLTQWATDRGPSFAQDTFRFVRDTDYIFLNAGPYLDALPLLKVLAYKVMILYNDDIRASAITQSPTIGPPVYTGIDAGINTWVVA
ncbi:MAG TPA: hypothetical protein VMS71_01325, partial [Candidatus Acidoferrum sp.]|nr:hypothetical protein [Candidatus Acidoferrum sp.]